MPDGENMPRMTIRETRNLIKAIESKAKKLYLSGNGVMMNADVVAIEKICKKAEARVKSR